MVYNDASACRNNMNDEEIHEKDTSDPHTKATALLINGMNLEIRAEYKDIAVILPRGKHAPLIQKIFIREYE